MMFTLTLHSLLFFFLFKHFFSLGILNSITLCAQVFVMGAEKRREK